MRAVLQVFENYQKARVNFVQTVADLSCRPQNIEALQNAGVMQLLRPLLLDNVPLSARSRRVCRRWIAYFELLRHLTLLGAASLPSPERLPPPGANKKAGPGKARAELAQSRVLQPPGSRTVGAVGSEGAHRAPPSRPAAYAGKILHVYIG